MIELPDLQNIMTGEKTKSLKRSNFAASNRFL